MSFSQTKFLKQHGKIIWIKHPNIGSGKITRRVVLVNSPFPKRIEEIAKHQNKILHEEKMQRLTGSSKKRNDKKIFFPSVSHKQIFQVWNNLGHPFQKHKTIKSKTTDLAMIQISKILKKYSTSEIIESMECCHRLFNSRDFKFKRFYTGRNLALPSFICYQNNIFAWVQKSNPLIPRSWFEECLNSEKEVREKYSNFVKDRLEFISNELRLIWKRYRGSRLVINDSEFNNTTAKWSVYLYNFCRLNNMNLNWLVDFIKQALITYKTLQPKNLYNVTSKQFYNLKLPEALLKYDSIGYSNRQWNTDWDEISKQLPKKISNQVISGRN